MLNFVLNLLSNSSSASNTSVGCGADDWVFLAVIVVAMVGMMVWNARSNKKRQQEVKNMLDAIQPGNKVKTIGGICGVVVEVCPEDNTFVLETGSELSGKSYIKFDKQAVYQTDAVAKPEEASQEIAEEPAPVEEVTPVEEEPASVEEVSAENSEDSAE